MRYGSSMASPLSGKERLGRVIGVVETRLQMRLQLSPSVEGAGFTLPGDMWARLGRENGVGKAKSNFIRTPEGRETLMAQRSERVREEEMVHLCGMAAVVSPMPTMKNKVAGATVRRRLGLDSGRDDVAERCGFA